VSNRHIQNQLQSNTIFFANTEVAHRLAERWVDEQDRRNLLMVEGTYRPPYFKAWDQQVLQDVLKEFTDIRYKAMPWVYSKLDPTHTGEELMPGIDYDRIVIAQHQASRKNKSFI